VEFGSESVGADIWVPISFEDSDAPRELTSRAVGIWIGLGEGTGDVRQRRSDVTTRPGPFIGGGYPSNTRHRGRGSGQQRSELRVKVRGECGTLVFPGP
jgi:hypothetical protein